MSLTATILAFVPALSVGRRAARPRPPLPIISPETRGERLEAEVEALATRVAKLELQLCDAQNRRDAAEAALERELARQAQERRWEVERLDIARQHRQDSTMFQAQAAQAHAYQNACQSPGQQGLLGAQQWCNCVPSRASLFARGR